MPSPVPLVAAPPRQVALAVVLTLSSACAPPAEAPKPGSSSASGSAVDTASEVVRAPEPDTGPPSCEPACKPWRECVLGLCKALACTDDQQCNAPGGPAPGDAPHYCYKGRCAAFQCGADADCGPGQLCNELTSLCYVKPTGCGHDADCVDGDPCTADTCDPITRKCAHKLAFGCCKTAADCDDGSLCTIDACDPQIGKCAYTSKPKCCTSDGNCADNRACTTDTCNQATGTCVFVPEPGCCEEEGACDDDDELTTDTCTQGKCVHALAGMTTACQALADCKLTACVTAQCVAGRCSYARKAGAPGCCDAESACTLDRFCRDNACVGHVCAALPAGGTGTHAWFRFDSAALDGWQVTKGNQTAFFHFEPAFRVAGAGALRYGVPGKPTWSGGFPNKGSVTSPPIPLPKSKPAATFYLWFDGQPASAVHLFGLRVLSGGKTTDVWTKNGDLKGNTGGAWKEAVAELGAFAGQKVQLRFWFDVAVSFPKENGHGLVIDELRIVGGCP